MNEDLLLPALIDDTTTLSLLQQRLARRRRFLTVLTGPTAVVKDWPLKRQIPYNALGSDLHTKSDNWCLEFRRFNRWQIVELQYGGRSGHSSQAMLPVESHSISP